MVSEMQKVLFPISLFETVHFESRIETIEAYLIKGENLKHNHPWFCFKSEPSEVSEETVSGNRPNSHGGFLDGV